MKTITFSLLCLLFIAGAAILMPPTTPAKAEWIQNPANGHYYQHVSVAYNPADHLYWEEAEAEAEAAGGYLATITSQEESDWIWNNLGGTALLHSWLGGFQPPGSPEPAGNWQWVTGETWQYTNWAPGEPNNLTSNDPNGENSLMLGRWSQYPNQWNDLDHHTINYAVDYASGYIIESTVPEPSAIVLLYMGAGGLVFYAQRQRREGR